MLVASVASALSSRPTRASAPPSGQPLDVVEVGGRPVALHTRPELETYLYLTGQGEDGPRVDPRARQLQSLARDGCSFNQGNAVEAYYSPAPVIVLFQDQPVTELPGYQPPEQKAEKLPYEGTELEGPFRQMYELTGDLRRAEEALGNPELAAFYRELGAACPDHVARLARASRQPLRDRELLLAAAPYPEADKWFKEWSEIKPEDQAAFRELVQTGLPAREALPAWEAVTSDRQQLEPRLKVWRELQRDLGEAGWATRILQNHPQGDPTRRLHLLHKLLADMEPRKAVEVFEKVHGSPACHRLHEVSRQPGRVEAARQWLERDDLVDAGADAEERMSALADLTEAHQGDLEQAQRDYLFVASRSDDWGQMQGMASFLGRLRRSCPDGREARLAFAALDLLPPEQAGPRAENLLRSFGLVGTFAEARPLWAELMKLSPEEGATRLDVIPGLPMMDPTLRRQLQVGQLCQPLPDETLEELASLVADPNSSSCANAEQAGQLLDRAFSGPEGAATVSRLFQLRQRKKAFGEAWAVLHHGEEAGPAWRQLPDDAALAEVLAARQPGEKLLDLARFYRTAEDFRALLPLVRAEAEEVGLEAVGQALENERNPLKTFRTISPPILNESLLDRLEAFRSLPPERADSLYPRLAEVLEMSDDLVAASRALTSLSTISGQAERVLALVAERRARGELRRPLQSVFSAVAEALVQRGGRLSPEELDEALARASITGIRETESHVLVGGVSLQRKS